MKTINLACVKLVLAGLLFGISDACGGGEAVSPAPNNPPVASLPLPASYTVAFSKSRSL